MSRESKLDTCIAIKNAFTETEAIRLLDVYVSSKDEEIDTLKGQRSEAFRKIEELTEELETMIYYTYDL